MPVQTGAAQPVETKVTPHMGPADWDRSARFATLGRVTEETQDSRQKLELNPVQVMASALAAVTSAVLLSTLGTAGTIIGAAIGSLIATSGAAIYAYSLRVGRERVAAAQAAAIAKVNRRRSGGSTRQIEVLEKPEDTRRQSLREILPRLPWKWIAIVAGAIFVVTMLVIVGFELLTGRSVSTYTGGSDGGGHRTSLGLGSSSKASQSPTPTPSPSPRRARQRWRTAGPRTPPPGPRGRARSRPRRARPAAPRAAPCRPPPAASPARRAPAPPTDPFEPTRLVEPVETTQNGHSRPSTRGPTRPSASA